MGYYTTFELRAERDERFIGWDEFERVLDELQRISHYVSDSSGDSAIFYDIKWYDHHEDLATLSLLYPDITFHLHGDGEEDDDYWETTYLNGRCHHRYYDSWDEYIPEYDPEKLLPCPEFKLQFLEQLMLIADDDLAMDMSCIL